MEVLEIAGYTEEEKLAIARDHLVQKQIANHGLTPEQLTISDEALLYYAGLLGRRCRCRSVADDDRPGAAVGVPAGELDRVARELAHLCLGELDDLLRRHPGSGLAGLEHALLVELFTDEGVGTMVVGENGS